MNAPNPVSLSSTQDSPDLSDNVRISPSQVLALRALMAGKTQTQAARAASVDPRTIYRWLTTDPEFQAIYNRCRLELINATQSRLLSLSNAAASTIEKAIAAGNVKAALSVLRDMKVLSPPKIGSDDPTVLERENRLSVHEQLDELETREWLMQAISGGRDPYGAPLCGEVRVSREIRPNNSGVIRYETHRR